MPLHRLRSFVARQRSSRFLRDAATLAIGTAIGQAITIITAPLLAHFYLPEAFGGLAIFLSAQAILTLVLTLKFEQSIVVAKTDESALLLCRLIVVAGGVTAAVTTLPLWIFRAEIAAALHWESITPWIAALPITSWFAGCWQAGRFLALREKRFRAAAGAEILCRVVHAGAALIFIVGSAGVVAGAGSDAASGATAIPTGLIVAIPLGYCMSAAWLLHGIFRRPVATSDGALRRTFREHRGMSFSLLASQGLSALSANIMVFGIAALYGDAVLGHYSMAVRLVGLPVALIASAMGDVYRQRAAELFRREGRFQRLMAKTVLVMTCIGVPGFTIAGLLTPWAVPAILGTEWVETAEFMMILLVSGSIGFISTVVDKAAVITNARRYILTWHIVRFVGSNAVLLVSWLFHLGPVGLVWGVCGLQASLYLWDLVVEYRLARGTGPGENREHRNVVTIRT